VPESANRGESGVEADVQNSNALHDADRPSEGYIDDDDSDPVEDL